MLCVDSIRTWASACASDREGKMDRHLVTVEVGVEAAADQRVDADGVSFNQDWFEGLDAHAVERGGSVEQHRVLGR